MRCEDRVVRGVTRGYVMPLVATSGASTLDGLPILEAHWARHL